MINKSKEIFRKMPGATEENATVAIVDPTSATGEEIDASVDRDRIRVVCCASSLIIDIFANLMQLSGATETAASFQIDGEDHTLGNALRYIIHKKYV